MHSWVYGARGRGRCPLGVNAPKEKRPAAVHARSGAARPLQPLLELAAHVACRVSRIPRRGAAPGACLVAAQGWRVNVDEGNDKRGWVLLRQVGARLYLYLYLYLCMHLYLYLCMYLCLCMYPPTSHVCICACMPAHTYLCAHTPT